MIAHARIAGAAVFCVLLLLQADALAHGGVRDTHGLRGPAVRDWNGLWYAWEWDPGVLIPLAVSAGLYSLGLGRMWQSAGRGHGIRYSDAACFVGGWLALALALVSPIHRWGSVLFAAHMTQHEILMLVAAPLLVLGRPLVAFLKALPPKQSRRLVQATRNHAWQRFWQTITNPFVAWLIHAIVLWTWHIPVMFEATFDSDFIHSLQHLSFLLSALLFWWSVMHGRHRAMGYGAAVLYMFTTALHSGLLGALITFAATVWYPTYVLRTAAWGLTPLEDQQIGGLIMWVPACTVYIFAGLALFAAWMRGSERRVLQWEADLAARQKKGGAMTVAEARQ